MLYLEFIKKKLQKNTTNGEELERYLKFLKDNGIICKLMFNKETKTLMANIDGQEIEIWRVTK